MSQVMSKAKKALVDRKKGQAASALKAKKPKESKEPKAKKPKEPKAPKVKKEKGPTIGSVAIAALQNGKTTEEALACVRKAFPACNTTEKSINWYRQKIRNDAKEAEAGAKPPARSAAKNK